MARELARAGDYRRRATRCTRRCSTRWRATARCELHPSKTSGDYARELRVRGVAGRSRRFARSRGEFDARSCSAVGVADADDFERLAAAAERVTRVAGGGMTSPTRRPVGASAPRRRARRFRRRRRARRAAHARSDHDEDRRPRAATRRRPAARAWHSSSRRRWAGAPSAGSTPLDSGAAPTVQRRARAGADARRARGASSARRTCAAAAGWSSRSTAARRSPTRSGIGAGAGRPISRRATATRRVRSRRRSSDRTRSRAAGGTSDRVASAGAGPDRAAGEHERADRRRRSRSASDSRWAGDASPSSARRRIFANDAVRSARGAPTSPSRARSSTCGRPAIAPRLVFDEFHHGYGMHRGACARSTAYLAGTSSGHFLAQALIAGLLLVLAKAPRPIVPRDPRAIARRSPLEHVDALGHAYADVGATRTATARLVSGVRRRTGRGCRAPAPGDDDGVSRQRSRDGSRRSPRPSTSFATRCAEPVSARELVDVGDGAWTTIEHHFSRPLRTRS